MLVSKNFALEFFLKNILVQWIFSAGRRNLRHGELIIYWKWLGCLKGNRSFTFSSCTRSIEQKIKHSWKLEIHQKRVLNTSLKCRKQERSLLSWLHVTARSYNSTKEKNVSAIGFCRCSSHCWRSKLLRCYAQRVVFT